MSETYLASTILRQWCVTSCMVAVASMFFVGAGNAQQSGGVSVNLGVLDDLDPMTTVPRLLMPAAPRTGGRIVLRPPPGVDPITPQRPRVVLRPPPGAPARVATAPTIAVPPPAAAAAPPTSVTAAPEPPPPAPAPIAPVASAPLDEPASPEPAVADEPMPVSGPSMASDDAPVVAEPDPPQQTASLPDPEADVDVPGPYSITFSPDQTELPDGATATLRALVDQLEANEGLRVQLMAYASSTDGSASSVRRKSLSRALSVREFLMDQGVQSTRIEVRALGDQNEGGDPDRVDAVVEQR